MNYCRKENNITAKTWNHRGDWDRCSLKILHFSILPFFKTARHVIWASVIFWKPVQCYSMTSFLQKFCSKSIILDEPKIILVPTIRTEEFIHIYL